MDRIEFEAQMTCIGDNHIYFRGDFKWKNNA